MVKANKHPAPFHHQAVCLKQLNTVVNTQYTDVDAQDFWHRNRWNKRDNAY